MSQLDPARYKRLTVGSTYGSDDGLYHDVTNDQICAVLGDTVVARFDATGMAGDLEFTSEANGDILVRVAGVWTRLAKGTAYQHLAMPAAADVPAWADDTLVTTVTLTPTTIAGNSAGDLGHADGVELVPAVANKIIAPVACVINYTFGVAAYTDGGNIQPGYKDGTGIMTLTSAATSLGAAANCIMLLSPLTGAALVGKALVLRAAAAFTAAAGQTGTASVKTYYRLVG